MACFASFKRAPKLDTQRSGVIGRAAGAGASANAGVTNATKHNTNGPFEIVELMLLPSSADRNRLIQNTRRYGG
jgi:hypothetical protein